MINRFISGVLWTISLIGICSLLVWMVYGIMEDCGIKFTKWHVYIIIFVCLIGGVIGMLFGIK